MIGREDEVRVYRTRVVTFQFLFILLLGIIFARLIFLQIVKGDELRRFSEANRLKKEKLFPARGLIFDRDGKVIVDNRASFDVVLLSQYYPFDPETDARLAKALAMPMSELQKKFAKVNRSPSFYPILLRADAPKDIIAAIEMDAKGFPGVDIQAMVQRRYPFGDVAAQLLGYIGEVDPKDIKNDPKKQFTPGDAIGKMGIERTYDNFLRGLNGVGYVEVDAMGRRRTTEGAERILGFTAQTDPVPGNNLYLTLDSDLEVVAAHAMKSRNFYGSVVALDPRNGDVLALMNTPSYDPGLISAREIDPKIWRELSTNQDHPLRNRAIQDQYPPGSTFKLILAIAGLTEGLVNPNTKVHCPGYFHFGNRKFQCWQRHGTVDLIDSIFHSCDTYFYTLGNRLGIERIAKYARLFGLGAPTGIKVAGEQKGLIADSEWKKKVLNDVWHPGDTISVSIGGGLIDVTPIQLALAYSAIANNGFVYRPNILRRIESRNGDVKKEFHPELVRKIEVPVEVFDTMREALFKVVNEQGGTAFLSRSKKFPFGGKTGTSQVKAWADISLIKDCTKLPYYERHHGWFVGFGPKNNPQIVVAAIAEHSCHGYGVAHVVHDVMEAYGAKLEAQYLAQGGHQNLMTEIKKKDEKTKLESRTSNAKVPVKETGD